MTAATNVSMKLENGSGNECKDISLDELMIFYAIIIQMAMKPNLVQGIPNVGKMKTNLGIPLVIICQKIDFRKFVQVYIGVIMD